MFHSSLILADVSDMETRPEYGWVAIESDGAWSFSDYVLPPLTEDQLKAEVMAQRDLYMAEANEATIGMADAYISGMLGEGDTAKFKSFAAYKLALNKIDQQPEYPGIISWPVSP